MEKKDLIKDLWADLAANEEVTQNFKLRKGQKVNVGFVNQYAKHDFIPNKWFDWERTANAKVVVIGQDWGPYSALLPYITRYDVEKKSPDFDYEKYLFSTFSSRTEKFIMNAIEKSYFETYKTKITSDIWNEFFFTVAVLFTRQGKHFRGSEFYDEKFGVKLSLPYLQRQIKIVQPKVIVLSGGTAWGVIRTIYNLQQYPETISEVLNFLKGEVIKINDMVLIPNFHPASHTDKNVQYEIWKSVWRYL